MGMHGTSLEVTIQSQALRGQGVLRPRFGRFEVHKAIVFHGSHCRFERRRKERPIKRRVDEHQIHALWFELVQMRHAISALHLHRVGLESLHLVVQLRHQGGIQLTQRHMRRPTRCSL